MNQRVEKLTIELMRACPNKCLHCSTNSSPFAGDMITLDQAKEIITQAKKLGLQKLILSGGEPLLYPDLLPLIQFVNSLKEILVVVYTSGSIFDTNRQPCDVPDHLLSSLSGFGVRRFNLSIHSHEAEAHDMFMNSVGSWDRAVGFLQKSLRRGADVHVHSVVTKLNCNRLFELAEFLDRCSIPVLRLLRLVPQGRAHSNLSRLELSDADWLGVKAQIDQIEERNLRMEIRLGPHISPALGSDRYTCTLDSDKLLIEPNGSVAVCPALKGARHSFGSPNVLREPLEVILQSQWRSDIAQMKSPGTCPAQELYEGILRPVEE